MRVGVTPEERQILLDTRMNAVLAPQLPGVLTVQERHKNEERACCNREELCWDRDVRVGVG